MSLDRVVGTIELTLADCIIMGLGLESGLNDKKVAQKLIKHGIEPHLAMGLAMKLESLKDQQNDQSPSLVTHLYLVEVPLGGKFQPIAILSDEKAAKKVVEDHALKSGKTGGEYGLVTAMKIDEAYTKGIGVCDHWHYDIKGGWDNPG